MRIVSTFVVVLALAAGCAPLRAGGGPHVEWMSDPSEALRLAKGQGKLVLVDAWAPWCAPCFEMDKTTWKDEAVRAAVDPFVRLKINHDVQKLFVERYAIEHLPILLVLDPSGDEITRVYGYQDAGQVRELAAAVQDGFEDYAAAVADRKNPEAQAQAAEFLLAVGGHPRALEIARKALRRARNQPAAKTRLKLALGAAQLGDGQARAACRTFREIIEGAGESDGARGRALVGLVRAERERGRDQEADEALQQLRASFPELAEAF